MFGFSNAAERETKRRNPDVLGDVILIGAVVAGVVVVSKVLHANPGSFQPLAPGGFVGNLVGSLQAANIAAINAANPGFSNLCPQGAGAYTAGINNGMSQADALRYAQAQC